MTTRSLAEIVDAGHMSSAEGAEFFRGIAGALDEDPTLRLHIDLDWWHEPGIGEAA